MYVLIGSAAGPLRSRGFRQNAVSHTPLPAGTLADITRSTRVGRTLPSSARDV